MGRKVTVIPPTISLQTHQPTTQKVKRKVAGYARVSTDFEEQLTSYSSAFLLGVSSNTVMPCSPDLT